jgi:glycosyltransferase involved in cell wall biosynthesis
MKPLLRAILKVRRRSAEIRDIARGLPRMLTPRRRGTPGPLRLHFVYQPIGAATRYRVFHQIEQAHLAGLEARAAPLHDPAALFDLAGCDLLYLHRVALAPPTLALCAAARLRRIPIVFDSDDLVWDMRERAYNHLDAHYPPAQVERILWAARRTRALMRWADAMVFSTPYLAGLAEQTFGRPTYVNPNAVSSAMLACSAAAYTLRLARSPGATAAISYFCGQRHTHDEDFARVAPALCEVLERYPQARVYLYGELRLPEPLSAWPRAERVERRPVVDAAELPYHIAQADINIAPLVDNPQRRAKSAVKYLEAALVGVPTVATNLEPYRQDIADGQNGFLATETHEWAERLAQLIRDPALGRRMGDAARAHVLAEHTTAARAARFAAIVEQVIDDRQTHSSRTQPARIRHYLPAPSAVGPEHHPGSDDHER